jgi:integrase
MGSFSHRPVRKPVQLSAKKFLQLLARPEGLGLGWYDTDMAEVELCLSPLHSDREDSEEDQDGKSRSNSDHSMVGVGSMVASTTLPSSDSSNSVASGASGSEGECDGSEVASSRMEVIRKAVRSAGHSKQVEDLVVASWPKTTTNDSQWLVFSDWCNSEGVSPMTYSIKNLTNFIAFKGQNVGVACAGNYKRTVLEVWDILKDCVLGAMNDALLTRVLKGIAYTNTKGAKYEEVFDIELLLDFIAVADWKSFIQKRDKAIILFRIYMLRRSSEVATILFEQFKNGKVDSYSFRGQKMDRDGTVTVVGPLPIPEEEGIPEALSLRLALADYLAVRGNKGTMLFVQSKDKESPLQSQTVGNRCKTIMARAKVPLLYKPHSIRHASASAMIDRGVSVNQIMRLGRWKSVQVFMTFYNRSKLVVNGAQVLGKEYLLSEDMEMLENITPTPRKTVYQGRGRPRKGDADFVRRNSR